MKNLVTFIVVLVGVTQATPRSFNFKDGRKLLLDVSVIHPQSGSVLAQGARSDGAAAPRRLKEMRISWPNTSTTQRDSDTSSSRSFSRCLADGVPSQSVSSPLRPSLDFLEDKNAVMDFWRKCLSVSLQRKNSRIILRKVKSVLPSISVSPVPSPAGTPVRGFSWE